MTKVAIRAGKRVAKRPSQPKPKPVPKSMLVGPDVIRGPFLQDVLREDARALLRREFAALEIKAEATGFGTHPDLPARPEEEPSTESADARAD